MVILNFLLLFKGSIQSLSSSTTKTLSSNFKPVTLITFDVDGTLVHGSSKKAEASAHARAFSNAIGKLFLQDNEYEKKVPKPVSKMPPELYHGSTDGLIALNFAKYALNIPPERTFEQLNNIFRGMYDYIAVMTDEEVAIGMEALPGVVNCLTKLREDSRFNENFLCGLVTGNVEGIARKKMRATGILQTGVLSKKSDDQLWDGENESAFLGGFGSDYCSGDVDDITRLYKDRAEQIVIASKRAKSLLQSHQNLVRVVHVGDAPNDVLAAKWCAEQSLLGPNVSVGFVGVATGKFSVDDLITSAGPSIPGVWEPVILKNGLADPNFIDYCNIIN